MQTDTSENFCELCEFADFKGILYCKGCFKKRKVDPTLYEIDKITEKIYLGNEEGGKNLGKLKEIGITHVLVCGADLYKFYPKEFVYHMVFLEDHPEENIIKHFSKCIKFIQSAKKVYVHCWAGVSRSASIVIAYLAWSKKLSFDQAFLLVKDKRDCINPNDGFVRQLKKFSEELIKNNFKLSNK